MKTTVFLLFNVLILPFILIIGNLNSVSVALFWISSFIITILYLKTSIKSRSLLLLFSPCFLTYFYSIFNYISGSVYLCFDVLSSTKLYKDYYNISQWNLFWVVLFLNICNIIIVIIGTKFSPVFIRIKKDKLPIFTKIVCIGFLFLCFFILHLFIFDFSFLGAKTQVGDTGSETGLNYPFIIGTIVLMAYKLNSYDFNKLIRAGLYFIIIIIMAMDSVGSKRELFFALLAILIVELLYNEIKIKISLKTIIVSSLLVGVMILYILSASITRGYGSFGVEKLSDAVAYVPDYVQSDIFSEVVTGNFETPGHYGKSVLACSYVMDNRVPLLFGETFCKVLFIPIPRFVFNYKPRNMIDVFTTVYDYHFRKRGGSHPVSIYSEFFANFHILGILFLYIFFNFFHFMYIKMIKGIRSGHFKSIYIIPFFALFLQFVRGSGLDMLVLYSLFAFTSIYFSNIFLNLIEKTVKLRCCQ